MLSPAEVAARYAVAAKLAVPWAVVRAILWNAYGHVEGARSRENDPDLQRACEILDVQPNTPVSEVRRRYHALLMAHHPNRVVASGSSLTGKVTTVYVGGQNAVDAAGQVVGQGDLKAQTSRPSGTSNSR
ncbi:MAG: hypothetical protein K6U89_12645 [Chloroflexi bacterium]|nr:hypothetical protein [Chloroflexota bacterium]